MTTDAERREATDQWTVQIREQRLRGLQAQIAERSLVAEQLSMALHVRDTQLAAITADRDDYRAKFRDLEHELQMERGQVIAMQQRAEAAEAELWQRRRLVAYISELYDSYPRAHCPQGDSTVNDEMTPPYEAESTYEQMVYYRGRVITIQAELKRMQQRAEVAEANVHRIGGELGQQRLVSKNLRGTLITRDEVSAVDLKRIEKLQKRVTELESVLREAHAEIVQAAGSPFVLSKINAVLDGK